MNLTVVYLQTDGLCFPGHSLINSDCDLMYFKGNINCYKMLLKYSPTLENTKFVAGELSLIVSLILYLLIGYYEP